MVDGSNQQTEEFWSCVNLKMNKNPLKLKANFSELHILLSDVFVDSFALEF